MKYEYSKTAGYYGTGGWICYNTDIRGHKQVWRVFSNEEDARDYCK